MFPYRKLKNTTTNMAPENEKKAEALRNTLRQHHAALVRDVLVGTGPLLDDWLVSFGLTASECRQFTARLSASKEQTVMLESLDDNVAGARVFAFAKAFSSVLRDAVSAHRFETLLAANHAR